MNTSNDLIERQVIRMLFILYFCRDNLVQAIPMFEDPDTPLSYIESETKIQKIDFWIRYPDHLSYALLLGCKPGGDLTMQRDEIKGVVQRIFHDNEPTLRNVPMPKYLRGAYEPIDRVMAFLTSRSLAFCRVMDARSRKRFILTKKGGAVIEAIQKECPQTAWYVTRCRLVQEYFGHLNGLELRNMQYIQKDYKAARYFDDIVRIEPEVQTLFADLFGEVLA